MYFGLHLHDYVGSNVMKCNGCHTKEKNICQSHTVGYVMEGHNAGVYEFATITTYMTWRILCRWPQCDVNSIILLLLW